MTSSQPPTSLTAEQQARIVELAIQFARDGRTEDLAGFLAHGVDVHTTDTQGNSLLMLAAYNGRAGTARMLIAAGADVNRLNGRGQSPLAGVFFKGEDEIAADLLAAGADLDTGIPTARQAAALFGRNHLLPLDEPTEE